MIERFLVGDQSQLDQFPAARSCDDFRLQTQQLCDAWAGVIAQTLRVGGADQKNIQRQGLWGAIGDVLSLERELPEIKSQPAQRTSSASEPQPIGAISPLSLKAMVEDFLQKQGGKK